MARHLVRVLAACAVLALLGGAVNLFASLTAAREEIQMLRAQAAKMQHEERRDVGEPCNAPSAVTAHGLPLVYVYDDLPAEFNVGQLQQNAAKPPPIRDPDCEKNFYSAEVSLHRYLLSSPARTTDPLKADLFYVPAYSACHLINNHPNDLNKTAAFHRRLLDVLQTRYPFWSYSQGRDHIFAFTQGFGARLFGDWRATKSSIFLVHNGQYTLDEYTPHKDINIPPDISHYVTPVYLRADRDRFREKKYLAHFGGTVLSADLVDERGSHYSKGVRQYIRDHFKKLPRYRITGTRVDSYVEDMMSSTFCLSPEGWHAWNPRPYYAILANCIPVLISDEIELAFEESIDYDEFMVRVHPEDISSLPGILSRLERNTTDIVRRRAAMERVWPVFHWGTGGTAPHAVLQHLAARVPLARSHIRRQYEQ